MKTEEKLMLAVTIALIIFIIGCCSLTFQLGVKSAHADFMPPLYLEQFLPYVSK